MLIKDKEEGQMRSMMKRREWVYLTWNSLNMYVRKMKIMKFKKEGERKKKVFRVKNEMKGKVIEEVRKYKYLKYMFQLTGG